MSHDDSPEPEEVERLRGLYAHIAQSPVDLDRLRSRGIESGRRRVRRRRVSLVAAGALTAVVALGGALVWPDRSVTGTGISMGPASGGSGTDAQRIWQQWDQQDDGSVPDTGSIVSPSNGATNPTGCIDIRGTASVSAGRTLVLRTFIPQAHLGSSTTNGVQTAIVHDVLAFETVNHWFTPSRLPDWRAQLQYVVQLRPAEASVPVTIDLLSVPDQNVLNAFNPNQLDPARLGTIDEVQRGAKVLDEVKIDVDTRHPDCTAKDDAIARNGVSFSERGPQGGFNWGVSEKPPQWTGEQP